MKDNAYLNKPSFYAHVLNGMLLFVALFIFVKHYKSILTIETYKKLMIILLFALVIGVHGLSHNALEVSYGFMA